MIEALIFLFGGLTLLELSRNPEPPTIVEPRRWPWWTTWVWGIVAPVVLCILAAVFFTLTEPTYPPVHIPTVCLRGDDGSMIHSGSDVPDETVPGTAYREVPCVPPTDPRTEIITG
jgi:hypothetical protein